jgi:hypothetical protein
MRPSGQLVDSTESLHVAESFGGRQDAQVPRGILHA